MVQNKKKKNLSPVTCWNTNISPSQYTKGCTSYRQYAFSNCTDIPSLSTLNHQDKLSKLGQKSNPSSSIIAWSLPADSHKRRNRLRPVYNPWQKCSPVSAGFVVTSRSILGRRKSGEYLVPVPILHTKILSYAPNLRYRHATNLCTVAVFIVEHSYVDAHVGRIFRYARNVPKFGA